MPELNKYGMTEADICRVYITPAIKNAGWDDALIKEQRTFTAGKVIVRGKVVERGKQKRADYSLYHSNKSKLPIAIIEAKDNKHSIGDGMQQGLGYASTLDIPFVYSSNGDGFLEHDCFNGTERNLSLYEFPTPDELWHRYCVAKNLTSHEEKLISEPYYFGENGKEPRYYQRIAINRTIDAIAKGQDKLLLVMATGTGKTYTAFQIIWRLWKSGMKKKILYLADRNILIDQTISNDFKPFKKVMTKIEHKNMDTSYQIYMSLYHQLSGDDNMEIFRQFKPEFFDLIIVDECHRGSAREDSRWRKILDYFSTATKIGMTATPKETDEVSNITYFGQPIYTYTLKQGIDDGFLAPYKVVRIGLNIDLLGYRPEAGKTDKDGNIIPDEEYEIKDFDKIIVIDERTQLIAEKITEYLKNTDRFSKTIVFCVDIEHAERMRQALVNCNKDLCLENYRYVMRITGDNPEGKAQLDNFIDPECKYPTIVTTSKLMTTGVDAQTCKLIVLDNVFGENGMTEFKQIIGRGTRINEEYGKMYFTIMDFRNASRLFADPSFSGEPIIIYEPDPDKPLVDPEGEDTDDDNGNVDPVDNSNTDEDNLPSPPIIVDPPMPTRSRKVYVNNVAVVVLAERVQYYDKDGKLITENLIDYTKRNILYEFSTLQDFLTKWTSDEKHDAIVEELKEQGVLLEALREAVGDSDIDDFDLICHIAYDKKPLTKSERAKRAKQKGYFEKYSEAAQQVINALLEKYATDGILDFEDTTILELEDFAKFGNPIKIAQYFGGLAKYQQAMRELKTALYTA